MRKLLLLLLSSLLVLSVLIGTGLSSIYKLVFDFEFIKQELEKSQVFELLEDTLAQKIQDEQNKLIDASSPFYFQLDELKNLLSQAIPPSWLQQTANSFLNELNTWLKSEDEYFDFYIDIAQLKEDFVRSFESALRQKEQAIPECSPEQMVEMEQVAYQNLVCLPPGVTLESFLGPEGYTFLDDFAALLPDEISFKDILQGNFIESDPLAPQDSPDGTSAPDSKSYAAAYEDIMTSLRRVRDGTILAKKIFLFWIGANCLLLALIILAAKKNIQMLFKWLGFNFISIGLNFSAVFLLGFFGKKYSTSHSKPLIPKELDPELAELVLNLISDILDYFNSFFGLWAGVALLAGITFYVGLWLSKKRRFP